MPIIVDGQGITPADIAVELGRPTPDTTTTAQWQSWIDEALYLIEKRTPVGMTLNQADLNYVVKHAVAEHIRHPDDATQVDVSVDDGSVSRRYQSGNGRVTIRDEWWDMLGLLSTDAGAFSVTPFFEPDTSFTSWV